MAEICPNEVDIEAIIKRVMEEEGLEPEDIKEEPPFDMTQFIEAIKQGDISKWSKRYFRGRAYAQFECDNDLCDHTWPSVYGWCVLDLKKQNVKEKFKQKCSLAKSHVKMQTLKLGQHPQEEEEEGVKPCYEDEESVERMVRWAVNLHFYLVGKRDRPSRNADSNYTPTAEHREDLCAMCKHMGRLCFERKKK